jgi:hypothetical protein
MFLDCGGTMSKRQEKIAANIAEQQAFIKERRLLQLHAFEKQFEMGLSMYEENKDKLTPEEDAEMQKMIEQNKALIEKLRLETDTVPQA